MSINNLYYSCKYCKYNTSKLSNFKKHLNTLNHKLNTERYITTQLIPNDTNESLINPNTSLKVVNSEYNNIINEKLKEIKQKLKRGYSSKNYNCNFCDVNIISKCNLRRHLLHNCINIPLSFKNELVIKHNSRKNTKVKLTILDINTNNHCNNNYSNNYSSNNNSSNNNYSNNHCNNNPCNNNYSNNHCNNNHCNNNYSNNHCNNNSSNSSNNNSSNNKSSNINNNIVNNINNNTTINNTNTQTQNNNIIINTDSKNLIELFTVMNETVDHLSDEEKLYILNIPVNIIPNLLDKIYENPSNHNIYLKDKRNEIYTYLDPYSKGVKTGTKQSVLPLICNQNMYHLDCFFDDLKDKLSNMIIRKLKHVLKLYQDDDYKFMSRLKKEVQLKISEISEESKEKVDNFIEIIENNKKNIYINSNKNNNLTNNNNQHLLNSN